MQKQLSGNESPTDKRPRRPAMIASFVMLASIMVCTSFTKEAPAPMPTVDLPKKLVRPKAVKPEQGTKIPGKKKLEAENQE